MSQSSDDSTVVYEPILTRSTKVRFYIPTEKDGADEVIDEVIRRLSHLFGGATQLPARGAYVMNDGELCLESVTLVESFAVEMDTAELTRLALQIKESLDEEAVAFETEEIESAFI